MCPHQQPNKGGVAGGRVVRIVLWRACATRRIELECQPAAAVLWPCAVFSSAHSEFACHTPSLLVSDTRWQLDSLSAL